MALVAQLVTGVAGTLAAQERRELQAGEPETQLMGYYAVLMSFLPVGLPDRDGRFLIGGTATLVPSLSEEDRLVSFGGTKSVNTNFCPAFPRITASKAFGRVSAEVAFTPSIDACGAQASVFGGALGYRAPLSPTWDGMVRVSAFSGTVDAAITCSEDMITNPIDQTCYGGSVSADRVATTAGAINLIGAYRGWAARRLEPYVTAGVRYERVDFDVNYTRTQAQADSVSLADPTNAVPPLDDHERFRATLARVQLGAGIAWNAGGRFRLAADLLYAPGAVLTASGGVGLLIGRSR